MQDEGNVLNARLIYPVVRRLVDKSFDVNKWIRKGHPLGTEYAILSDVVHNDCDLLNPETVYKMKFVPFNVASLEGFVKEFNLHWKSWKLGVAPEIFDAWISELGGVIIMKKLNYDAGQLIVDYKSLRVKYLIVAKIFCLLRKLHENNIVHHDNHLGNIMAASDRLKFKKGESEDEEYQHFMNMNYTFYLIDYGEARTLSENTSLSEDRENNLRLINCDMRKLLEGIHELKCDFGGDSINNVFDVMLMIIGNV